MSFDQLIYDLGALLDEELYVDGNGVCQLIIDSAIALQLEPDATQEKLLIASALYELPPGKYRENVLSAAMCANGAFPPPIGILSYFPKSSRLFLYRYLKMPALTAQQLLTFLSQFLSVALQWQEALKSGQSAPVATYITKKPGVDL